MKHRHLNHEEYTPAAIDDIIDRGLGADWDELVDALRDRPELTEDVRRLCAARATDPEFGARHSAWLRYIEHWRAYPNLASERAGFLAEQLHAEEVELEEARSRPRAR